MRHQVKAAVTQAMRATVNKPCFVVTGYLYICMLVFIRYAFVDFLIAIVGPVISHNSLHYNVCMLIICQ